ncbi:MAG: hypothetical protein QXU74_00780 [Candidatus Aenigmatarchaeota archaeon]
MKMKIKRWVLVPVVIVLAIAAISYFFFVPKDYRNDCGKSLEGFSMLFVYSLGCPHCKSELSKIKALNLTEEFYMIDGNSDACKDIINQYSDYLIYHKNSNIPNETGFMVPVKLCLKDNKTYVGEMGKEELKEFYENCTGVKA